MTIKPKEFLLQSWKAQLDTGLHMMATIMEGATKIREAQLEAASFAHADAEATRKAIAAASDASKLLKLQTEWTRANVEKSLSYWRSMYQAVMETNAELVKCMHTGARLTGPNPLKGTDLDAFRQWLEFLPKMYKSFEKVGA
jgi:phasin family protein